MAKKSKPKSKAKKSAKAKPSKAKSKKAKKAKPAKKAKKVKAKKAAPAKSKKAKSKAKAKPVKKAAKKKAVKKAKPAAKKKVAAKKPAVKKAAPKAKSAPVKKAAAPVVATPKIEQPAFVPHATSLREGMSAPYFEARDQHGNTVRSSDFMGKTIILYFYPKDDTPGCTAESCSLRDEYLHLSNSNYAVIGVSADDMDSHQRFAEKYHLPFPLLADTDRTIINAYDVWGPKEVAGNRYDGIVRTTFVIDADGIIKNVVTKVDTANHAKQIMGL